ncbi:MAG: cytochrome c oxidase subunit II [Actinomycetota bacterium]
MTILCWAAAAGCSGEASALDPAGPGARRVEGLWWLMFAISCAVFVVVLAFLAAAVIRSRRPTGSIQRDVPWGNRFVIVAGIIIPCLILGALFVVSLRDMSALSAPPEEPTVTIEVVARVWWWEIRYPEAEAVTANEIYIPADESVQLRLLGTDVIHSFWVPRLQVKTDHIPDRVNTLWLKADEPGRYRGQCAEFCGIQHANMIFWVEALPRAEFDSWLAEQAEPAQEPTGGAETGEEVFLRSACAGCHAVRGTEANAQVGPDLTHLAERETIVAGVLSNTRANLRRFIEDPQEVKPGIIMPPVELADEEMEALLDYLEQLD